MQQAAITEVSARRVSAVDEAGFPDPAEWDKPVPVRFDMDWQGKNEDAGRETEVRLLWTPAVLFVRFVCRYRELTTFPDAEADGYRHELWDRDVAEIFVQPDRFGSRHYKEFEVAPNGYWIDLDIYPGGLARLNSGLRRRVQVNEAKQVWTAELALPVGAIGGRAAPGQKWLVNFYRCEGTDPGRWYSAWRPTCTEKPNFHVPESFGVVQFE